ncbi:MAG: GNAT family N-acetyltransferase [Planctomycetes bacterium]|nr:GNAT family N-acetyltransferase [Planctomycetota bacterium]
MDLKVVDLEPHLGALAGTPLATEAGISGDSLKTWLAENRVIKLASLAGEFVGFAYGLADGGDLGVFVLGTLRGKGIGTALAKAALAESFDVRGLNCVRIKTREEQSAGGHSLLRSLVEGGVPAKETGRSTDPDGKKQIHWEIRASDWPSQKRFPVGHAFADY